MDPNATRMFETDPNRTQMGNAPSLNVTQTIAPVQCPICKTFNPAGEGFCVECGLIFESALPDDAFGAPAVRLPCLVDESGREHFLRPGTNLVGREGDVMIQDSRLSRKHAEVIMQDGVIQVRDLGSTNGTTLNDEPVGDEPVEVKSGDIVAFADNKVTLSIPGNAGATQMLSTDEPQKETAKAAVQLVIGEESYPLTTGDHSLGRRPENDIILEDPYASGAHALISVDESGTTLTDLGSTNGTFVNGARLAANEPITITTTDALIFGRAEGRIENV
ncbi:MAG: FHA domain-containing protein [Fimbriimonadales bacterium]